MLPNVQTFDIRVKRVKFHRDDTLQTVFDGEVLEWRPRKKEWTPTRQVVTCSGYFFNLIENDHIHVKAEEVEHELYGPQWQVYLSERVTPGTEAEMLKFLTSIKGIGQVIGRRLIDAFGLDVISTILTDATCLNTLGLPQPAKDALYRAIVENKSFEKLLIFLQGHGLAPKYATQIYRMYESHAVEKIKDNPYALYLDKVIDFPAAARLDDSLSYSSPESYRNQALLLAILREDSEGNGNLYAEEDALLGMAEDYIRRKLSGTSFPAPTTSTLEDALRELASGGAVITDHILGEGQPVYLYRNFQSERAIGERLFELMDSPKKLWAPKSDILSAITWAQGSLRLTAEQKGAIHSAFVSPVSILTGGPGTGKTQTLQVLVQAAKKLWPGVDIRICAPTGKAAMRAQELTGAKASTIHRALGYPHNNLRQDELVCDFLIADEYSMCDADLCSWLLRALNSSARLLIVGDHEQLPSVGPGLVLRDMIQSEMVPVNRLTQVFRQGGGSLIVHNAHAIIKSRPGAAPRELNWSAGKGGSFYFIQANDHYKIQRMMVKAVKRMLDEGFSLDQITVISPIHGSPVGTDAMNAILQEELNPRVLGIGCIAYQSDRCGELRPRDKVIQMRNDYDLEVFNGETGVVKKVDYSPVKAVLVEFPGPREVWYSAQQVEELDLAYSITAHRSQGSEFDAVVIPICRTLLYNVDKNVMYTAITRAKKRVVLVGDREALDVSLAQAGSMDRNSHLALRIQEEFLAT